jgi:hypothetical protein
MNSDRGGSETPQEPSCGPRIVHSTLAADTGPAWTVVSGPAAANFDHWPVEADDPPPAAPDGFDSFA